MNYALSGVGILVAFLILDGIWLLIISKNTYKEAIGELMRPKPKIWPSVLFYVVYAFAILELAVFGGTANKSLTDVIGAGITLGAGAYGAYNLTCYSILDKWPLSITIKDWIWGTTATTISAIIGYYIAFMLL